MKTYVHTKTCVSGSVTVLFMKMERWKPKCDWLHKIRFVHTGILLGVKKETDSLVQGTAWTNLQNIMLL